MNKNLRKLLLLVTILIVIVLIFQIIKIYAVFHSELEANVELQKGVWNIFVNEQNITTGTETTFVIDNIETEENQYVKPGKLAPGLSGNFKLKINPQNTNVSVRYDISLDQEELGDSNLKLKSVEETETGHVLVKTGENMYTGVILLDEINEGAFHLIEVELEWIDDGLKNESDAEIGKNAEHILAIPITVHTIQYLGEEITPMPEDEPTQPDENIDDGTTEEENGEIT